MNLEEMTEEEVIALLTKVVDKVTDRKSAVNMCADGTTVRMLLQLLRSPNSSKACVAWAPSKLLRLAATAAGELPLCPEIALHPHECYTWYDRSSRIPLVSLYFTTKFGDFPLYLPFRL